MTYARARWCILGAGSFGTAFAHILGDRDIELTLAAHSADHAEQMRASGTNERYFPGVALPSKMSIVTTAEAVTQEWDVVVLAVPTRVFSEVLGSVAGRAKTYLSLGKGLDPSGRRLSEVAAEHVAPESFVALSGPNIAKEIMRDLPTAAVVACVDSDTAAAVQRAITGHTFRVYVNNDVVGVELAGASKNVIAIAAGILEGVGVGDNGVAAMMTRGLGEMARLGLAHGAQLQTYLGLAGVGDLMVTCRSEHSRNHRAGRLIAQGMSVDEIREEIGQAVEGLRTAPILRAMSIEHGVEMHICHAVADMAEHGATLADVIPGMFSREPGFEFATDHEFQ